MKLIIKKISMHFAQVIRPQSYQKYVQEAISVQQDRLSPCFVHLGTSAQVVLERLLVALRDITAQVQAIHIKSVLSVHTVLQHQRNLSGVRLAITDLAL